MKKYKILICIVLVSILVGCQIDSKNTALKIKLDEATNKILKLTETNKTLSEECETLKRNLENEKYKVEKSKDDVIAYGERCQKEAIDAESLQVNDTWDGFKITYIKITDKNFEIKTKGYFVLEGEFQFDGGYSYVIFDVNEGAKNIPIKTVLRLKDTSQEIKFPSHLMLRNEELLKDKFGDDNYNKFGEDYNFKIKATILLKDYQQYFAKESEIVDTAEIVDVIEMNIIE